MDWDMKHAFEKAVENVKIETYSHLVEITDVVNWNNFQEFTIGTKTFYTDGELTYEPAIDVMNGTIRNLVRLLLLVIDG